ncbi:MAG: UDP-N-acetylglucosamine--N-acetylmuramyl-(pentapeptide) pyrophosphoryl-undecaprenol N-acetylglucosamine transferase, partial [Pedosphaera parvula]|nr:UDP-N-acetylglucosamine--N-acetylmuramyl-(pentapeptide) pyrophosphoryl-undecaprenol N-acetylglucosamine transferase [Pedosphaera parvula]
MATPVSKPPFIAIACGGTGGHLFPGMAVGEELLQRGCAVTLLISPKEIDQQAARSAAGMEVVTLPAVGLTRYGVARFLAGAWKSYRLAKKLFRSRPPQAVLAMGGFTSAPPVWAGKGLGAATFFHESNAIPGRANRWLGRVVDEAFLGLSQAASYLPNTKATTTGTPVRAQFQPQDAASCRLALGLDPHRPVLLIMGGSQGATGINELVLKTLPTLAVMARDLQFLHLTGPHDF